MPNENSIWDLPDKDGKENPPTFEYVAEEMPIDRIRRALGDRNIYKPRSENKKGFDAQVSFRVGKDQKGLANDICNSRFLPFRSESDFGRFAWYLAVVAIYQLIEEDDPELSARMEQALLYEDAVNAETHKNWALERIKESTEKLRDTRGSSNIEISLAKRQIEKFAHDPDNRVREAAKEVIDWHTRLGEAN